MGSHGLGAGLAGNSQETTRLNGSFARNAGCYKSPAVVGPVSYPEGASILF
jgi:hypothetical protein